MPDTVRVFISATSADLASVREDVAAAMRKLKYQPEVEEDFEPDYRTVEQSLRDKIGSCQAVIHIVGFRYGGEPRPDSLPPGVKRRSWTQREHDIARELGKPVFVFLCQDGFPFDDGPRQAESQPESEELRLRQRSYRESLISMDIDTPMWHPVATREELALRVREIRIEPDKKRKRKIAPSRILRHVPRVMFGREPWLEMLDAAWRGVSFQLAIDPASPPDSSTPASPPDSSTSASRMLTPRTNICTLVAWGGVGKTSLVAHWVNEQFAAKDWPGVERYFDWSFYSQGTGESRQTSSDLFISRALTFFGDKDPTLGSPWERGERLAQLVRKRRTLLVLDGIEPLQYPSHDPQAGMLKDEGLAALLQGLAADNPGLCVVTTRESLANLHVYNQSTSPEHKLDELPCEAAVALLRHLRIDGSDQDLTDTWREAGGHALTLQLLGRYLADAHGGDVRKRDLVNLQEVDRETQGRSAFKVMAAYERWLSGGAGVHASACSPDSPKEVHASAHTPDTLKRELQLAILRLTGLFDRPITPDCLAALRADPPIPGLTDAITPLTDAQWNTALNRLASIDLISLTAPDNTDSLFTLHPSHFQLDAHPLIREYFAVQLREQHPEAFRAAHGRLFDHLCESTKPHHPEGLDGLQPLYQAVVHGCLAGRQQDACEKVYRDRILRGTGNDGFYSTRKLGAIGSDLSAVAAFFDQPWSRLSPNLSEADQAWLLNEAAFRLRALGRLTEALEPMRVAIEMAITAENWKAAAIRSSNLSELEVTLGRLESAVADARRGINFADRSGDAFWRMVGRTTAADALHQSGAADEARGLFADAERMQQDSQPQFDLLYSVAGFRSCDLLLAPAERAAWRAWLHRRGLTFRVEHPRNAAPRTSTELAASESSKDGQVAAAVRLRSARLGESSYDNAASGLSDAERTAALQACTEVERRATQTLADHPNLSLLTIALDNLTLSRATLYAWLLRADSSSLVDPSAFSLPPSLSDAVNGLRKASSMDQLPRGLLTSSVCHVLAGEFELAVAELNEALQIARRGPMPLFHSDILLTRARLFGRVKSEVGRVKSEGGRVKSGAAAEAVRYPWDTTPQADLAEARQLIEHHGYLRRLPELEDAEAALAGLSD